MLYSESLVRGKESVQREIKELNETLKIDESAMAAFSKKQEESIDTLDSIEPCQDAIKDKKETLDRRFSVFDITKLKLEKQRSKNETVPLAPQPSFNETDEVEESSELQKSVSIEKQPLRSRKLDIVDNSYGLGYRFENFELDTEYVIKVVRHLFAACLVAASCSILFHSFMDEIERME